MDREHRESDVKLNYSDPVMLCHLVLDVVISLIISFGKRSPARYKEIHVHVVVDAVANIHVVAVGVVLVVVIVVVVVVLVGVVDDVSSNSSGNNSSSEITPDGVSTAA